MNSYHDALFMIIRWYILAVFIKSCTTTNRKLTVKIDQPDITGCLNAFPWKFRVRPRFFDQVGHNHFSPNFVIVRLTKIMNRADKN